MQTLSFVNRQNIVCYCSYFDNIIAKAAVQAIMTMQADTA